MQNKDRMVEQVMLSKQLPPYRVQINDVLSIRIKALDQSLVGMFNPISDVDNVDALTRESLYSDGFFN
jgi:polysaccharide export outer membrane protein